MQIKYYFIMGAMFNENEIELTNNDGIQKACEQIEKEEEEVNLALEALIQRQCHLGGKLRSISQALSSLNNVKLDVNHLGEMINYTSSLAENVSAKVRQLDEARSRVSECQQRVHDLIDLKLCSEGVQTALKNEDYEKGAAHVHRFLSMDPSILQQTAADVSDTSDSEDRSDNKSVSSSAVSQSCATLHSAADKLRTAVTHRFNDAVRKEDIPSVERFFKIFPLLGMHEEGLQKFSTFLCSKIQESSQKLLRAATDTKLSDQRASVVYADAVSQLFESIAKTIEVHQPLIETYYGPGRLFTSIFILQKEADRQINKLLIDFTRYRRLNMLIGQINEFSRNGSSTSASSAKEKPDPKLLDSQISEVSMMHSRIMLYFRFIRRRVINDIDVGITNDEKKKELTKELEILITNSQLSRASQELLGYYLILERYFMEESIQRAIQLDTIDEEQLTSSLIDDVFFIVRKCIRRATSTGSIDGVCAVINEGGGRLESAVCPALKKGLRPGLAGGYLDLATAYSALQTSLQQGRLQTDTDRQKATFLAQLNNSDVSVEYVETLCHTMLDEVVRSFPNMSKSERGKLESCLSGLSTVSVALKNVNEYGLQQLRSSAIKPRINPWIDSFNEFNYNLTEEEFESYDTEESFIHTLLINLDGLLNSFKDRLTSNNFDSLVAMVTTDCVQRLEKIILKTTFNKLGGLIAERAARALCAALAAQGAGGAAWPVARERCARLTAIAALLAAERTQDAVDSAGAGRALLSPQDIRNILSLRSDFKLDEIKRLKL